MASGAKSPQKLQLPQTEQGVHQIELKESVRKQRNTRYVLSKKATGLVSNSGSSKHLNVLMNSSALEADAVNAEGSKPRMRKQVQVFGVG